MLGDFQFPYGSPIHILGNSVDTLFPSFSFILKIGFVRYCDHVADSFVLNCAILWKKAERSVHSLSHSRLSGLEHMRIDIQSSPHAKW